MVHFNELKITSDGKYLIIDVSVSNEGYYENVYLDSIVIDNQDTYVGTGPSSNPVYEYTIPDVVSPITDVASGRKNLRLVLDSLDLGSLKGLFFVYVKTKGTPSADTPCGMDNITTMATVTNMYPFYQQAMNYIGELASNCSVPQNFIDYILRMKGLELAVKTGNYPDAIKYYNKFFNGKEQTVIRKGGCSCGNS